jgi:ABC-type bacteriocin/lantibiotic exporter with double-glycine peptidase domain
MDIRSKVVHGFLDMLDLDKRSIYLILYYTLLEGVLVLSIPLTSSFVINSLVSHSYISVIVLGSIISIVFIFIIFLRLIQEYIIEKFEQRVFVTEGYDVAQKAFAFRDKALDNKVHIDKLMNYFFDITTVQKTFPIFILNGAGLVVQVVMTLLLLLLFDVTLFFGAFIILLLYIILVILFGKNGIVYAVERSDTKHNTIHFLQKVPFLDSSKESMDTQLEENMDAYVDARQNHFRVRLRQLGISFLMQGSIIAGFFMLGSYLVIKGHMPIGEFVAAEIIIVTLIYAMNNFIKQLDYIYDGIEGFYKIEKLSSSLDQTKEQEDIHA